MNYVEKDLTVGEELFRTGKYDEARNYFEQLIQKNPENYEAINNLGTVLYQQGHVKEAEQYYQIAFSVKEDDPDILLNLADLYFYQKKWTDVLLYLERYLRMHPEDFESLNKLALVLMELGEYNNANNILEKSLSLNENQEDIRDIIKKLKLSESEHFVSVKKQTVPIVSFGLPVYNGGKLLPQAIESILSQDFGDFELIISDNGSNDETQDVCLAYQQKDHRIKYCRFDENLGMLTNFLNVLGRAAGQFFMFATHDDLRDETLLSSCIYVIKKDSSIALVYPRSKVLDSESQFIGFGKDGLIASQENPLERFKHVIWEFSMGNSILGLFRTHILKKITSWGKALFGDNLVMAEVALLGKIIQIDAPLFFRRLTRNYNYSSYDERNAQLIAEGDPCLLNEGISFPHSRLAYAHLELLNQSNLSDGNKDILMKEVFECFRTRFGTQMTYEIDRAIALINKGTFYRQWNQAEAEKNTFSGLNTLETFHVRSLLKRFQEAMFFFPERNDLMDAYKQLLHMCNSCEV